MVGPQIIRSRFKNRYGEPWEFLYDPATGEASLRGADVDWQEFRVVDGQVPGLNLNAEEKRWLRVAWEQATRGDLPRR